ncbi:unnamed protein product [Durusdinium trenchii]|uniref:Uncharacterized protein n=1 Tax=Durusdinium trenchii TaxID=1381693 RepID=A0ABP0SVV0_9DINO
MLEPEATPEVAGKDRKVDSVVAELERSNQQKAALEQQKASLEHQLEEANHLLGQLRADLIDRMQQQGMQGSLEAQDKSAGPPREGSTQSLLASADALAFATRAAMDAAKAVKKAKFQSGIAALPFSSPGLAVKQHLVGYTAEPVARSASPAMTPSPSSYRIALGASRSGAMTPSMPTASSRRSWEAVPQLSQSCQAIAQLPINPSAYRMPGAYTPSPSPRGRQAQRVDLRTSSTPSPSPRAQVPVAPVAQHFPAPQTGPRRFQTPPVQPANANWLYSQPISVSTEAARSLPKRRPSSSNLERGSKESLASATSADGFESAWDMAPQLGNAKCLQVAPDMFLVRVPSSETGTSPQELTSQDSLSTTFPLPVRSAS